jgi:hypothetical protein
MNNNMGIYLVQGEAGNSGMAGAPTLNFSLMVVAETGKVSGIATISQALGTEAVKQINNVTGEVFATGFNDVTKLVAIKGTYVYYLPPPMIGVVETPFEAIFAVDNAWNGVGGFRCGTVKAENVKVRKLEL